MSNEQECCESCEVVSSSSLDSTTTISTSTKRSHDDINTTIRILTWSDKKSTLQFYAELYKKSYPETAAPPNIQFFDVPSLKELDYEVTSELKSESILYDGFVVPPLFLGNMYQQHNGMGLAIWDDEDDEDFSSSLNSSSQEQEQEEEQQQSSSYSSLINDLLPYYRYEVATFDDKIRSLPILAGSQTLLLFRKDYLDEMNLPTPKTWNDWTRIASTLNQQLLGPNGQPIYGACLGLLNEDGCRKRNFNDGGTNNCNSQSMTYLGMMLSSMTQVMGNSTGWMMGLNHNSPTGVDPLFQPTLEYILKWMEQQIMTGGPSNQLTEDSSYNMQLFRDGRCAMTVTSDYDAELLKEDTIGFVPLPGSDYFLDRTTTTTTTTHNNRNGNNNGNGNDDDQIMKNCTDILCPFGKDYFDNDDGNNNIVNLVPFGATDATVGTVSGFISKYRQEETRKFYKFVLESSSSSSSSGSSSSSSRIQPLTYSELENSIVPGYETTMTALTSNQNAAIPFRVPNAFNLLSELDNRVYEYLVNGDYDDDNRKRVTHNVVNSWQSMISMYDFRDHNLLPTSVFYEKSLGVFVPEPASDLYIGWVARGVMWGLGGVSCLLSVCLAIWVWKYQHERVIRGMLLRCCR
jgi:maltose-binding protein MalE